MDKKQSANIETVITSGTGIDDSMTQNIIGFGPYVEGNKVSSQCHETISAGKAFSFIRASYKVSFIPSDEQTVCQAMDLADATVIELTQREVMEAKGEEYIPKKIELPNSGRSVEITFGMTIPTARYQSEKFDVAVEMHIPDDQNFEEAIKEYRSFLEERMVSRMRVINSKISGK